MSHFENGKIKINDEVFITKIKSIPGAVNVFMPDAMEQPYIPPSFGKYLDADFYLVESQQAFAFKFKNVEWTTGLSFLVNTLKAAVVDYERDLVEWEKF